MKLAIFVLLIVTIAVDVVRPQPITETEVGKPYAFEYQVRDDESDLHFGHQAKSDGKSVSGFYNVLLPDGRTQIVTYTADKIHGYVANVEYFGGV